MLRDEDCHQKVNTRPDGPGTWPGDADPMTRAAFLTKWTLASGTGMALGFLAFVNVVFVFAFGLQFDLYWTDAQKDLDNAEDLLRRALLVGLPLAGGILTSSQALVMRNYAVDLRTWILTGPIGFVVPVLLIWPFTAIWGDIPGPVEPFTVVGGGLLGTAALQWWALHRRGMKSKRWLLLWSAGIPLGAVVFMLIYVLISTVYSIGWAGEVGLIGFAIGGTAAALSGRSMLRTLSGEAHGVA
jgi:hypothetical protein